MQPSTRAQAEPGRFMGLVSIHKIVGACLVGVVLYGVVVAVTGFEAIAASLVQFQWSAFAFALTMASLNYSLRFLKWQYYLRVLNIRNVARADSALIFLSGFVLTVTPGKVGEVFKSAVLARTHGVPVARTAPIVLAERLTDVLAIVLLVGIGCIGFEGGVYWAGAGAGGVALILAFVWYPRLFRWVWLPLASWRRIARWVPRVREAHSALSQLVQPSALLLPVALSVVGWGLEGLALHGLLQGFGADTSLPLSLFFYATSTLAGALVPVPGGLGVTESILFEQLVKLGSVAAPVATASMLLIRLATLWWAVVVGFVALGVLRLRYPVSLGRAKAS